MIHIIHNMMLNIVRLLRIFFRKRLLVMVIPCAFLLVIKYFLIKYNIEFNDIINKPYITFVAIFTLAGIKQMVKTLLDEYIFPQHLNMEGGTSNSTDNLQQNSNTNQDNNITN